MKPCMGLAWVVLTLFAQFGWCDDSPTFVDLSLMVNESYPCTWPEDFPPVQIKHFRRIGRASAYNVDILTVDGNTGTQIDVPPHSIPRPESGLPGADPLGDMFTDKVPAWQLCGEACVIDVQNLLNKAPDGHSPLIGTDRVQQWEQQHRRLGAGDVVLMRSGYTDRYYRPFPEGRRFLADPLANMAPAWPGPDPPCMDALGKQGVKHVGLDSPSIGPRPNLGEPTHLAGLKHGMIFTEGATGLQTLPPTGALYCSMGPRYTQAPYGEARAFAIMPGPLSQRLIKSAREHHAVDLSVVLSPDLPVVSPGIGIGNHRHPFIKVDFAYAKGTGAYHHTHMMDSHVGTHLVPPAYALPSPGFSNDEYSPEVQAWLAEYEREFGPRGTSDTTTEQVPIQQTCGPARVIDVRHLVGSTQPKSWPQSPAITMADIARAEQQQGPLKAGEVVIFHTGHVDRHFRPLPEGSGCWKDPLNGRAEGWPAPGPEVIAGLAAKGIRCVATDAPTLGGVDPRRALMTYWILGTKGMVGVEFLTQVGQIPKNAYFLFAPIKIQGCHGGPGRAIALFD